MSRGKPIQKEAFNTVKAHCDALNHEKIGISPRTMSHQPEKEENACTVVGGRRRRRRSRPTSLHVPAVGGCSSGRAVPRRLERPEGKTEVGGRAGGWRERRRVVGERLVADSAGVNRVGR